MAIASRKQLSGCIALTIGSVVVIAGLSTNAWVTGIVNDSSTGVLIMVSYNVGLLSVGFFFLFLFWFFFSPFLADTHVTGNGQTTKV